jgi:hypothetical protein
MQEAGIDSGMTRTTSNAFGYGGQWSETSAISIILPLLDSLSCWI